MLLRHPIKKRPQRGQGTLPQPEPEMEDVPQDVLALELALNEAEDIIQALREDPEGEYAQSAVESVRGMIDENATVESAIEFFEGEFIEGIMRDIQNLKQPPRLVGDVQDGNGCGCEKCEQNGRGFLSCFKNSCTRDDNDNDEVDRGELIQGNPRPNQVKPFTNEPLGRDIKKPKARRPGKIDTRPGARIILNPIGSPQREAQSPTFMKEGKQKREIEIEQEETQAAVAGVRVTPDFMTEKSIMKSVREGFSRMGTGIHGERLKLMDDERKRQGRILLQHLKEMSEEDREYNRFLEDLYESVTEPLPEVTEEQKVDRDTQVERDILESIGIEQGGEGQGTSCSSKGCFRDDNDDHQENRGERVRRNQVLPVVPREEHTDDSDSEVIREEEERRRRRREEIEERRRREEREIILQRFEQRFHHLLNRSQPLPPQRRPPDRDLTQSVAKGQLIRKLRKALPDEDVTRLVADLVIPKEETIPGSLKPYVDQRGEGPKRFRESPKERRERLMKEDFQPVDEIDELAELLENIQINQENDRVRREQEQRENLELKRKYEETMEKMSKIAKRDKELGEPQGIEGNPVTIKMLEVLGQISNKISQGGNGSAVVQVGDENPKKKRTNSALRALTKDQKARLKHHSGSHSSKHISSMRMHMMRGKTWDEAHKKAMEKWGKN